MKPVHVFLTAWMVTGAGAVAGSILGNAAGTQGLFIGAVVGGVLGVALSVTASSMFRWLPKEDRASAIVGGIIGFAVAAPIAVANLRTPITPVLICALAGVGVLLGAKVGRRRRP